MQIVTCFAAVETSLSQSSSGSGSRDTLTMFNLHLCLIFRCSLRAIWLAFLTMILSSLFVVFLFSSKDLQIFNTSSKCFGFFKILLTLVWLQPTWSAVSRCEWLSLHFRGWSLALDPWFCMLLEILILQTIKSNLQGNQKYISAFS